MTYTSIQQRLKLLEEQGRIGLYEPLLPGGPCSRYLFLTQEVHDELDSDGWEDESLAERYAAMDADFLRYREGDVLPVGLDPYEKDSSAFLARVHPAEYGIWTIRSYAPKPSVRIFGAFAEKDTFVALMTRGREELDGPGGRLWLMAREGAIAMWHDLFEELPRLTGDTIDVFLSENYVAV